MLLDSGWGRSGSIARPNKVYDIKINFEVGQPDCINRSRPLYDFSKIFFSVFEGFLRCFLDFRYLEGLRNKKFALGRCFAPFLAIPFGQLA